MYIKYYKCICKHVLTYIKFIKTVLKQGSPTMYMIIKQYSKFSYLKVHCMYLLTSINLQLLLMAWDIFIFSMFRHTAVHWMQEIYFLVGLLEIIQLLPSTFSCKFKKMLCYYNPPPPSPTLLKRQITPSLFIYFKIEWPPFIMADGVASFCNTAWIQQKGF